VAGARTSSAVLCIIFSLPSLRASEPIVLRGDSDLLMFLLYYSEARGEGKCQAPARPGVRGVEPQQRRLQLAGGRHPVLRPRRGAEATGNGTYARAYRARAAEDRICDPFTNGSA
jgi:hypothetical protein